MIEWLPEWLFVSLDTSRLHVIGTEISWHARLMVATWSFLIPFGIISARFFKIMPKQTWPEELDNRLWWISHLSFQYLGGVMMLVALWLVWSVAGSYENSFWHKWLGWLTIALCGSQYLSGWFRGSKGGPAEVARTGTIRGDHFDMTKRRNLFEYVHKSMGYICLFISWFTTVLGIWMVNAPVWMWIFLVIWWVFVIVVFSSLQRAGKAYDTYQAIWGDDPQLPGNQQKPIGLGIVRKDE